MVILEKIDAVWLSYWWTVWLRAAMTGLELDTWLMVTQPMKSVEANQWLLNIAW